MLPGCYPEPSAESPLRPAGLASSSALEAVSHPGIPARLASVSGSTWLSTSEITAPAGAGSAARRRNRRPGLRFALLVPVVVGAMLGAGEAHAVLCPDGTEAEFCLPPPVTPPITPPVTPPGHAVCHAACHHPGRRCPSPGPPAACRCRSARCPGGSAGGGLRLAELQP